MTTTNHYRNRQERELNSCEVQADLNTEGTIFYDGSDTECRVTILSTSGKTYYGEGFAFLAPGDHYDRKIGEQLAYARATIDALEDMELAIISAAKTEEQFRTESRGAFPAFSASDRLAKLFPGTSQFSAADAAAYDAAGQSLTCGPTCVACHALERGVINGYGANS